MPNIPIASAFVGIDWADQKHDVCVRPADGSEASHEVIESKPEKLQDWIVKMRERYASDGRKVFVCLEQSKGALIYQLMEYDFFVLFPINPKSLAKFREAFFPSGSSNDPVDAALLAELVHLHHARLKCWKPEDEPTRKLAAYCYKRRKAVQKKVRLVQEMRAELKLYHPFVLELFAELDTPLVCDFLQRWPTLEALRGARAHTLRKFFYAHGSRSIQALNEALEKLPGVAPVTSDAAIIEPAAANVTLLAAQLRVLLRAIAGFEREIKTLFESHPDAAIFASFPGAGPQLGPRLLTSFGTDRERISKALELSTLSGIAPGRKASGKSCLIYKRWACPKFLRQNFHEFAGCSLPQCAWAKAFYDDQRRKNKGHHTAVRALAFKWMRILFACWHARTPYDESHYLASLQRHGSPFASA